MSVGIRPKIFDLNILWLIILGRLAPGDVETSKIVDRVTCRKRLKQIA